MPQHPNKISQFWSELKRRKVFRVVAMYAGAAYIIIELVNNVSEPLHLPEWTATLVILLLVIGFPIVAILSWIFDLTPEGVQKTESIEVAKEQDQSSAPVRRKLRASDVIIVVLIIVVGIMAYPKIFKKDKFEGIRDADGRISVAVMPFQNMTNDTLWDIWQNGIQNELITKLSNSKELAVRQYQTMNDILQSTKHKNYTSITPFVASDISRKLEANTFILGSIKKSGDIVRINAQLIDSETEGIFKSFQIDGNGEDDMLFITDSLSKLVRSYLELKVLEKELDYTIQQLSTSSSPEAYKYFIQGADLFYSSNFRSSIDLFNKALEIDTNFFAARYMLVGAYGNSGKIEAAKQCVQKNSTELENLTYSQQLFVKQDLAIYDKDVHAVIKYIGLILEDDPQLRNVWYSKGMEYRQIHQYGKAAECFEKALELDNQWGVRWEWVHLYRKTGDTYHKLGNHDRENEIYELGLSVLPDHPRIIRRQAICALSIGDTIEANGYLTKYFTIREELGLTEMQKLNSLGDIYWNANLIDKAEQYYNQALILSPNYALVMNNLASLMFEQSINIDEGMQLINQALELEPDNSTFLTTKGWGLYKQGKLEESLTVLKESWEEIPFYNHDHYLHIQEVEKALANQNK